MKKGLIIITLSLSILVILGIVLQKLKERKKAPSIETKIKWLKYVYSFSFSVIVGLLLYFLLGSPFFKEIWNELIPSNFSKQHSKFILSISTAIILTICFALSGFIKEIIEYSMDRKISSTVWDNLTGYLIGKLFFFLILFVFISANIIM